MVSNRFLTSLKSADHSALEAKLSKVALKAGECLVRPGAEVSYAYLPITAVISVITTMQDGARIESRTVGREGGFGLLHALGSRYSYEQAEVQVSGDAWRIATSDLKAVAMSSVSARDRIVEYAQVTLAQAAQAAACNALHDVRQRMCKWLLLTQDRVGSDTIPLTQEHLSIMLGVQRTTVTSVAAPLQAEGLIRYRRGRITILDTARVRQEACECYEAIETSVRGILTDASAA
jgi:CRP-like cAMP-binding protein